MATLKNLALALLNATVLLVALCLFLALLIMNSAERVSDTFSEAVSALTPVRTEVSDINEALQGLRSDVQSLAQRPGAISDDQASALTAQIETVNARLDAVNAQLGQLGEVPDQVVTTAIDYIADRVSDGISAYRNCTAESADTDA